MSLRIVVLVLLLASPIPRGRADEPRAPDWPSIEAERRVVEYEVRADTFEDALAACRRRGKNGWPGFTEWDLSWRYRYSDYRLEARPHGDGQRLTVRGLTVEVTSVRVEQTTYLPRLVPGEGFPDADRRRWERWLAELREHEAAHLRISSAAAIEVWLRCRVASVRTLEGRFPAGLELGSEHAERVIEVELTAVYEHALARIRDKNKELDQRTGHGPVDLDWDAFLEGYF